MSEPRKWGEIRFSFTLPSWLMPLLPARVRRIAADLEARSGLTGRASKGFGGKGMWSVQIKRDSQLKG